MAIDAALGRLGIKPGVCTSSTRPANPYEGQVIYETDTNRTLVYDNAAWLVVADNQVLSIDTTNSRVGIGTTTPSNSLHVYSPTVDLAAVFESGDTRATIGLKDSDATTPQSAGIVGIGDELAFRAGGSDVVRIDSSGNVGINDTAPSYKLDVNGDINATGALRLAGSEIGARVSFTPSWRSGITIGNGTNQWYYMRINQYILVWGATGLGSTSAVTGGITMYLPTGGTHTNIYAPCGQSFSRDATSGSQFTGQAILLGGDYIGFYQTYTGSTYASNTGFNATVPFTWTTGDVFGAMFFYRQVP